MYLKDKLDTKSSDLLRIKLINNEAFDFSIVEVLDDFVIVNKKNPGHDDTKLIIPFTSILYLTDSSSNS